MTPEQIAKITDKDLLIKEGEMIRNALVASQNFKNGAAFVDAKLREQAFIKRAQELLK